MKLNIMVTATGSAIAQGIMKSIRLSNIDCDIITTDTQPYSAGLYRGKRAYLVPMAKEKGFVDEIIEICNKENIDAIFIGTDYELLKFAENKERIEKETNAKVIVSSPEIVKIADDKWLTHKFLVDNNLPHIPSVLHKDEDDINKLIEEVGFPLIIKPRIGDSSKDTFIVRNKKELREKLSYMINKKEDNVYLSKKTNPIIQKYLQGEDKEYTSTTVTFGNKCYGVVSMNREMRFDGHTIKAVIRDFPDMNNYIKKVAETLNALGPANFQSRIFKGIPRIFEINCRFSGTTPFCSMIGFNTVEVTIKKTILKENIKELYEKDYKKGTILRYFNEVFIPENNIKEIEEKGYVENPYSNINKVL